MIVSLTLTNTNCKITGLEDDDRDNLKNILSYMTKGAFFAQKKRTHWDGKEYFLKNNGNFPTGLLFLVEEFLNENKIKYSISDTRTPPSVLENIRINLTPKFKPRPYQMEAAHKANAVERGIMLMATGSGKTFTAALLIAMKRVKTLFVVPDVGLRTQATATMQDFFPGQISNDLMSDAPIIVVNIQNRFLKSPPGDLLKKFQMLIVDEFHHSAAKTYLKLNKEASEAYFRYGFTGTFSRTDGREMVMHGVLSNIIYTKTTSDLIEEGYLVEPFIKIYKYMINGLSDDYKSAYDEIIVHDAFNQGVAAIANKRIKDGKQVLVLVRRVEHGECLSRLIPDAVYLNGTMPIGYRDFWRTSFEEKSTPCIIATEIFGEGTDIPNLDVYINARLQKTEIGTLQGIGRVLRNAPGKYRADIYDFLIDGNKYLRRHSKARIRAYRGERAFNVTLKEIS